MCTSANNLPISIIWNWSVHGEFLFLHWHSQPFNGKLLDKSCLLASRVPNKSFPHRPIIEWHCWFTATWQFVLWPTDKLTTMPSHWWCFHCRGKGQSPKPELFPTFKKTQQNLTNHDISQNRTQKKLTNIYLTVQEGSWIYENGVQYHRFFPDLRTSKSQAGIDDTDPILILVQKRNVLG